MAVIVSRLIWGQLGLAPEHWPCGGRRWQRMEPLLLTAARRHADAVEAKRGGLDEAQRTDSTAGLVPEPTAEHIVCRLAVCCLRHGELVRLVESALELASHWHDQGHDRRVESDGLLEKALQERYEEVVAEVGLEILKGGECRRLFVGDGAEIEAHLWMAGEVAAVPIWALPKFAGCFVPAETAEIASSFQEALFGLYDQFFATHRRLWREYPAPLVDGA